MCGIAGIIYKDGEHNIGQDMTRMLQSMKHRGPDSTGYALYAKPTEHVVMRYTTANTTTPRDFEFQNRLQRNRAEAERQRAPRTHPECQVQSRGGSREEQVRRRERCDRMERGL